MTIFHAALGGFNVAMALNHAAHGRAWWALVGAGVAALNFAVARACR